MAVKEFFATDLHNRYEPFLIFGVIFDQSWKSTTVYLWIRTQSLKTIMFCLIVFITPENMSCIHIKQ